MVLRYRTSGIPAHSSYALAWLLAAALALAAHPASAQEKIGTVDLLDAPIEASVTAGADPAAVAWSHEFDAPGAPWIIVHFRRLNLPARGSHPESQGRLEFETAAGETSHDYWGRGPARLLTEDGFWTELFHTHRLTLRLYGDPDRPVSLVIDRWAYGDPVAPQSALAPPIAAAAAECPLADAKCLETGNALEKLLFDAAKAVARLRIEYRTRTQIIIRNCTGFLYQKAGEENPKQNRLLTADHCFPWTNPKSITAEFRAERAECTENPNGQECTGTSFAGKLLGWSKCCDVAWFSTQGKPGEDYGLLILKSEKDLEATDKLFLPQHPGFRCKEYSRGNFEKLRHNACREFLFCGSSEDGSSGAPVIDESDRTVVGVLKGSTGDGKSRVGTGVSLFLKNLP
jgi:hypothetical protein